VSDRTQWSDKRVAGGDLLSGWRISRDGGIPLHVQVRHQIIQDISSGRALPGTQLPSVRDAAERLGVTAGTVQKAYRDLRAAGFTQPRERRGNFVSDYAPPIPQPTDAPLLEQLVRSLLSRVRALGHGVEDVRRVLDAVATESEARRRPKVWFVARTPQIEAEHVPVLQSHVADISDVRGVSFARLRELASQAGTAAECDLLVTLIPSMDELRRAARVLEAPAMGLVIELTPETQELLLTIPRGASIGVVAEEPFLDATLRVVVEHLGVQATLTAVDVASKQLPAALRRHDIVCASATAYPTVRKVADGSPLIELRYRPTQAALNRLRSILEEFGATADQTSHDR
jgi:DNA-binding transcriptional regulator YhcF (GntR family)